MDRPGRRFAALWSQCNLVDRLQARNPGSHPDSRNPQVNSSSCRSAGTAPANSAPARLLRYCVHARRKLERLPAFGSPRMVEGLTEFLPVSSTAHLRIAEALFHISLSDGYWKMYSIVIQLGAILCLPVYSAAASRNSSRLFRAAKKGSHDTHSSSQPCAHGLCGNGDPVVPVNQDHWQASGKHADHGWSLLIGGIVMWIVDAQKRSLKPRAPMLQKQHSYLENGAMSLGAAIWIGSVRFSPPCFPGLRARCRRSPPDSWLGCRGHRLWNSLFFSRSRP